MTANNVSLEITYSSHFTDWLAEHRLSLALTTYQTNRLFLLGLKPDGRLSAFERLFNRPMALHVTDSDRFYLSTQSQLWQLDNALSPNNPYNGYDKLYVPRQATTTGNLDIHDLTVDRRGQILFANTLYSCLSTLSERYSFKPLWCPHFISSLQPEDRCHLNGLALVEGEPRYVTTISRSDTPNGWREQRHEGGCVIEVPGSETVLTDLSMPHSPRWYRNKLWLLQAGSGDFGYVSLERGRFEPVAFCPGYLRGLAFHDYWAIVGLSKPRYNSTFSGLALDKRLTATTQQSHCGLLIINLNTGQIAHWLRFEGVVNELYDVQVLPGVRQPMALGFKTDEIQHLIAVDQSNSVALHQIISTQNPVSVASPSLPKQPYRLQVSHKVMLSTVMINYKTLILPQLQQRLQNQSGQLPLTVVTATRSTQTLGLILAASHPDGDSAEVLSLFVAHEHRRQGLGLTLLTTLENILANKNCNRLNLVYQTNWPDIAAIEGLLQKSGWSLPQTHMLLCKTTATQISKAPWLQKTYNLPNPLTIFPWANLTLVERQTLQHQQAKPWFPPILTPFQEEDKVEWLNSLGLRTQHQIVGWMITHRLKPDTIQYSALFVRPPYQNLGAGTFLLVEAIRRQFVADIPKGVFMINIKDKAMLTFMQRRLQPYLTALAESRQVSKQLQHP